MKILLTHASAGAGHMKAAEAVFDYFKNHTKHEVVFLDALDYTSPFFKTLYRETYKFLITHIPWIWGIVFKLIDVRWMQPPIRAFRRLYNTINAGALHRYLIEQDFDYIYSMHFMPTEVAAALKRSGKISSHLITVVTDYDVHKIWTAEGVNDYCVACPFTAQRLMSFGIEEDHVHVTGIPTNEKFSKDYDRDALREQFNLKKDAFTALVATGSFGIGPIEQIIDSLDNIQVIVVCGHNKDLFERLNNIDRPLVKVFGLVDNMHELMAMADVMITKPGGLSISEAMVRHLPLIFFNAIPGQESNNIFVLNKHEIGIKSKGVEHIVECVHAYKKDKDLYNQELENIRSLARPNAAKLIADLAV